MNKNKIKRLKIINDLKLKFDSINLENLCAVNHKKENIEFKCKKCGNFFISSIHKLNKFPNSNPCPFCGNFHAKLVNKELFIYKANKIYNNKYSYEETHYVNSATKIKIICPIHGVFYKTPGNHLQGQGCTLCSNFLLGRKKSNISKDLEIIKNKFPSINWNNFNPKTQKEKIKFLCKTCNNVSINSVNNLLKMKGSNPCIFCGDSNSYLTLEAFRYKANKIHNFKYSYPEQKFLRNTSKLRITCPKHGEFTQTGSAHIQGQGCYSCGVTSSKGEEKIENFLIEKSINYKKQQTYKDRD